MGPPGVGETPHKIQLFDSQSIITQ